MHFHDSFIAHFFPVLSLSCCHKQTSAVLLLFIIHKSNKVASQDGARAASPPPRFPPITSFVHIHFVLCLEDPSYSLFQFSPTVSADTRKRRRRPTPRALSVALVEIFMRAAQVLSTVGNLNRASRHNFRIITYTKKKKKKKPCDKRVYNTRDVI